MASLFDQYERFASLSGSTSRPVLDVEPNHDNSIINMCSDSEDPIFSKHKLDFLPVDNITHLVVSNNHVVIALRNKTILRMDLLHGSQTTDTELTAFISDKSHTSRVNHLFLDPTGKHCIINVINSETQVSAENLYLARKCVQMSKMRGHVITAVGWNYEVSARSQSNTTANILIGTNKGLIFESELVPADESKFFPIGGPEQYFKQAFELGSDAGPVSAIEFHKIRPLSAHESIRLYQFVGNASNTSDSPYLYQVFNTPYSTPYQDMPRHMNFSQLNFYYPNPNSIPQSFGWLTGPGVLCGRIDISPKSVTNNSVISDTTLLTYRSETDTSFNDENPIGFVLTQYHVLILMRNFLKIICVLNDEVVFEEYFTETYGKLVGIAKDPTRGTVWVFTHLAIYRYRIVAEDRNIWKIYLAKRDFEAAKRLARNDAIKTNEIICSEANYYFSKKNYEKSASLYALSHKCFEEIALKFIQINEDEALKQFLVCKLDTLSLKDTTQLTVLVLWLIEIQLNQMGSLKNAGKESSHDYQLIEAEFESLLSQNKNCLIKSRKAVYDLIESHGNQKNWIHFAVLMQDYDRVIEYHLQHKNYSQALTVLRQQGVTDMFYRFAPIIMQEMPAELISLLIQLAPQLDSTKLIPALCLETIRYLEHCAYKLGDSDPVIHNYLLALYAQTTPDKLMTYLSMKGEDESTVPYDIRYAARICCELGLERACVHLYSTMGMCEEAVDLALTFDIQLAKQTADRSGDQIGDQLRKKLWLRIARHVISSEEKDIKTATKILKECELLKIEDILPFFPDFATIDHFKEAICSSLQEYNRNIESLKEDMKSATESAHQIRQDIKAFRNKFTIIRTEDNCTVCSYPVLNRAFYAFPCGHLFHNDCLVSELMPYLPQSQQQRVDEIQRNLNYSGGPSTQFKTNNDVLGDQSNSISIANDRERLLNELDDIVGNECFYCGDIIISSIDQPFILPEEMSQAMEGWD
ncbi:unnamed protein product [Medioppia subpectinata]|uniref:Vacuolar protein sorting-associated protein 18 homolog n=1 Tax=Medioppia subpectinata TaxID=1979941 RepID=A0A7R9Q0B1_9ACAR|nr:unnamed protein product [Medioppia subpectinata]CAG2107933.1 unnamed protein product [Medioppia subpectinata]